MPTCVHQLFEAQVDRTPDAVALAFERSALTYAGLDRRANRLARHLRGLGAGPETLVGLAIERSPEQVVGLLAILKAGAAYLPLDPSYPSRRLAFMMADARLSMVLTGSGAGRRLPSPAGRTIDLEAAGPWIDAESGRRLELGMSPDHPAYVLYTSGSTGRPKAVVMPHRVLVEHFSSMPGDFSVTAADSSLVKAPLGFDTSVRELFLPLVAGGRAVLAPAGAERDVPRLLRAVSEQRATLLQMVASMWPTALEQPELADCGGLRWAFSVGEALAPETARRLGELLPASLGNLYGPTETAMHVTWQQCRPPFKRAAMAVGRPTAGTWIHLLDLRLRPAAATADGEVCVAGVKLARGYLRRPGGTAERFVPDPWSGEPGSRLYRTGDLGRRLGDGSLELAGRIDHQLKIGGQRIEVEEIEATLGSHPSVREALVVPRPAQGSPRLTAYVVPRRAALVPDAGWQRQHVDQWRSLYDGLRGRQAPSADPTLDFTGWTSSYDGRPIPEAEMRRYVESTVARILELRPRRLLEIGCGTGLLLFRVAPSCRRLVATDLSAPGLRALRGQLLARAEYRRVRLLRREADDFSGFDDGAFDAVVLSSVVQYFPGVDYLRRVLREAVAATAPGGAIFVGDVRSLPLLDAFCASVELHRAEPRLRLEELGARIRRRRRRDKELLLDPGFFTALAGELPRITEVRIRPKRSRDRNELIRFRYDVTLHLDGRRPAPAAATFDWQDARTLEDVESLVERHGAGGAVFTGVPNARLTAGRRLRELLAAGDRQATAGRLRRRLEDEPVAGIEPEDFAARLRGTPWACELSWARGAADGAYDVLVWPRGGRRPAVPAARPDGRPLANDPLRQRAEGRLIRRWRRFLEERLPALARPASFVILDALPRTPHGKIDRAAVSLRAPAVARGSGSMAAPSGAAEQVLAEVWGEVLGVEGIGRHDDFFELGGHSLLGIQVLSRLRRRLGTELAVRDLFDHPTVARLAGRLQTASRAAGTARDLPLARVPRSGELPASFSQRRFWFLDQLRAGGWAYNLPAALRLAGRERLPVLAAALDEIVRRHESLRTRLPSAAGRPRQAIAPAAPVPLPVVDLTALGSRRQGREARRLAAFAARRPFDLARGPLVRAILLRLAGEPPVLLWCCHHAVSDGWSLEVFRRELAALYDAFANRRPSPLPELPIQYADYAVWQRRWLRGAESERLETFWREQLEGAPRRLRLPAARPRPAVQGHRGAQVAVTLSSELSSALAGLGQRQGVSLFMTLLAAFAALLSRLTGDRDLMIGAPVVHRPRVELEGLIGLFLDTVPLRLCLPAAGTGKTFRRLLRRAREITLAAWAHQELPFERMVRDLNLGRDLSHHPVFQVMLNVLSYEESAAVTGIRPLPWNPVAAKLDLSLEASERPAGIRLNLVYCRDLFDRVQGLRLLSALRAMLAAAAVEPEIGVDELPLLSRAQRQQLLREWADSTPVRGGEPLSRWLAAPARRRPDAVAVVCGERRLSHGELRRRSVALARRLRVLGVGEEVLVGVFLEPSPELVVALVAILEAGGVYVPLDPELPPRRLGALLEDTSLRLVLTRRMLRPRLPVTAAGVLCLDRLPSRAAAPSPDRHRSADALAYAIYTSGSTGRPKGVLIGARGLEVFLRAIVELHELGPADTTLQLASCGFDISIRELLAPLLAGARLALVERAAVRDPGLLLEAVRRHRVTCLLGLVPAVLEGLVDTAPAGGRLDTLRLLAMGGDRLPADLAARARGLLASGGRVVNQYGPTECTGTAAAWVSTPGDPATVPLGRPHPHRALHVLDHRLSPAAIGVTGEICAGGAGVGRGYLRRPALTAAVFVPDPFSRRPGERLYRTGDLGRHRGDGALEFRGRRDLQLKIRGVRVEAGEIEQVLRRHPAVREAAVRPWGDDPRRLRLVAYVTGPEPAAEGSLRAFLRERLSEPMMPAAFVYLEALPRTLRGKLDRAALPPPEVARPDLGGAPLPPRTETERRIAEVWRSALSLEEVGIEDNFFDLGGHSLLLVTVRAGLRRRLGRELAILDLFRYPTIAALAGYLKGETTRDTVALSGRGRLDRRAAVRRQRGRRRLRRPAGEP